MKIIIKNKENVNAVKELLNEAERERFAKEHRWSSDKIDLDISRMCDETIQQIHDFLDGLAKDGNRSAALSRGQVK